MSQFHHAFFQYIRKRNHKLGKTENSYKKT